MSTKNELRKIARKSRSLLDIEKISKKIIEKIINSNFYKKAQNIMIFYPLKGEVNLLPLLNDKSKNFYLPKVEEENLLVCPYKNGDELIISTFKTIEPKTKPIDPKILDVIFVPALMVDKNFYRLGYGMGFYDRFLSQELKAVKIVAIPESLVTEKLPSDEFDARIDIILDES